ncbi:MAG: alkaline phosphatase [Elusimicrobia bacterium]|nr:alkaline phosphatase [Elusimicrobiota bacterium]
MKPAARIIIFTLFFHAFVPGNSRAGLKNIIVFIGDGMGSEHVRAAGMYKTGKGGSLFFESFPGLAEMTTYNATRGITDSAAAATAMATGHKVDNSVLSMAIPGDGEELETILEYYKNRGKSAGLVSTAFITHATPAAFAAHEPHRDNFSEIADDYLNQTRPDVLLGGGGEGMSESSARAAGYSVVSDRDELRGLDTEAESMVSGQFAEGHMPYEYDGLGDLPHLSDMTRTALRILDNNPNGFFLMVEGARIDHASVHSIERVVFEVLELENAIEEAVEWAGDRKDTLILVTADHETGGLEIKKNNGKGNFPSVEWNYPELQGSPGALTVHTSLKVPLYAWGERAAEFEGELDNTELFGLVTGIEAKEDLDNVYAYPNPCNPREYGFGVTFANVTANAELKIFNIAGELVYDDKETGTDGRIVWHCRNNSGESVASGIYLAMLEADGKKEIVRIAVVK